MNSSPQPQDSGGATTSATRLWLRWSRFGASALVGGSLLWIGMRLIQGTTAVIDPWVSEILQDLPGTTVVVLAATILVGAVLALLVFLAEIPFLNVLIAGANFFIGLLGSAALLLLGPVVGPLGGFGALVVAVLFMAAHLASLVDGITGPITLPAAT